MLQIQNTTADPQQTQTLVLPDGTQLTISMYYSDQSQSWLFTNITYGSFVLNTYRITNSPNMLHQYRNQIPFGISCFSTQTTREPSQQEDFSSGLFGLYVLTAAEVNQYYEYLTGTGTL